MIKINMHSVKQAHANIFRNHNKFVLDKSSVLFDNNYAAISCYSDVVVSLQVLLD